MNFYEENGKKYIKIASEIWQSCSGCVFDVDKLCNTQCEGHNYIFKEAPDQTKKPIEIHENNVVWILTSQYNDYDQHGEYFEEVFYKEPSEFLLNEAGVNIMDIPELLATCWTNQKNYIRYHLMKVEPK